MCSDLSGDAPLDEDRQPGTGAGARALPDLLKENKKQLLTPSSCHEAASYRTNLAAFKHLATEMQAVKSAVTIVHLGVVMKLL